MIAFIKKYPLTVLMIVLLLMLFPNLGLIQTNIMEARNLITAREMVHDGHWIFTTMNGLPRFEKPPLPTWITAFFMMIFGMQNMFMLRLPVALISLMLVYFFYRLMKYFKLENNQPLNASLILITSFYIFFAGRDNQWDMYTHAFMIACIFFLLEAFKETKNITSYIILSGLFFGCSFLSKGPVSLYAVLLPFLISYFIVYRNDAGRKVKPLLFILLIGLIIGLSWPLYVRYFNINASSALSKQTQNWGDYEVKPLWYYWSFFIQSGIWTIPSFIALMYFYMRKHVTDVKAYKFSFLWTIISLILLSVIPEKKVRYTLPVLIPLAMNTSFYIEYLLVNFKQIKNRAENSLVYFSFGLIALIGITIPFAIFFLFKTKLEDYIFWYALLSLISFFCAYLIVKSLVKKQFVQTFYATVFFMCGVVVTAIPLSKIYYTNTTYYPASNIHLLEKNYNIKTYEFKDFVPEIIWSYGNVIPGTNNDSIIIIPKESLFGLMISENEISSFKNKYNNFQFTKLATVDLNDLSKNQKGYNGRLVKDYYLVKENP